SSLTVKRFACEANSILIITSPKRYTDKRMAGMRMNSDSIRKLFEKVRRGKISPDDAVQRLRHLPFEDLGFAKVDHHRALRVGMPEVIFAHGKSATQVREIFFRLAKHGGNVLATRAIADQFKAVKKKIRRAEYRPEARAIILH